MSPQGLLNWAPGRGPTAASTALFEGHLLAIPELAGVAAMAARARMLVEQHFGADPERAESRLAPADYRRAASAARKAVRDDPEIDAHWEAALAALGYAPATVHRDRMRLRVVPSRAATWNRVIRPLPVHRDSWASCIAAQINWWTPLYPLDEGRTLLIWPAAFEQPVANTARDWDYDALLRGDLRQALLPEAAGDPPGVPLAIRIPPGTLLAFAAAHLHGSRSDDSGITRFGLDTRTVWTRDVEAGRGAPDVDGPGGPPRWAMFERTPVAPPV